MANTKILVVEDEKTTGRDIQNRLKNLGYTVPTSASSADEAIKKAVTCHPDLVLIDIQLKGEMNGLKAAKQIHDRFGIPVVYLMEDADEETLQDEKVIEPFSYVLKPCEENSLRISIERALYKHKMGRVRRHFNRRQTTEKA